MFGNDSHPPREANEEACDGAMRGELSSLIPDLKTLLRKEGFLRQQQPGGKRHVTRLCLLGDTGVMRRTHSFISRHLRGNYNHGCSRLSLVTPPHREEGGNEASGAEWSLTYIQRGRLRINVVHLSGNADQKSHKVLGSIPTPLYVEFARSCWGPGFPDVCCLFCPAGGVEEPVIGYSWRCRWTHLSTRSCCYRASMVDLTPVYSCVLVLLVTLLNRPYNKEAVHGHLSHCFWVQERTQFSQKAPGSAGVGPIPVCYWSGMVLFIQLYLNHAFLSLENTNI